MTTAADGSGRGRRWATRTAAATVDDGGGSDNVRTLRTQDTSHLRQFGTSAEVPVAPSYNVETLRHHAGNMHNAGDARKGFNQLKVNQCLISLIQVTVTVPPLPPFPSLPGPSQSSTVLPFLLSPFAFVLQEQ